ncbi:alkaline phosphatase [Mucisphaera sp.]|uniref:alkaline phosphatase n=1 Tax=Mucisphaera sp. TaxID=2913024 RepID=UPI003D0BD3B7
MKTNQLIVAALGLALIPATAQAQQAKNIILMISDGAGDTTWRAANQWQFGTDANTALQYQQTWENEFTQHWMTTYPGHTQPIAPVLTGGLLPSLYNEIPNFPGFGSYDPIAANDNTPGTVRLIDNNGLLGRGTPVTLTPNPALPAPLQGLAIDFANSLDIVETQGFAAYDYLVTNSITDSAAAGTALATGVKTYNSAISVDLNMNPLDLITEQAAKLGKKTGVVSTKPFTDATPAAFGTNNIDRNDEANISHDMIHNGLLDVIISPGHPEFGSAGVPRTPSYDTVSQANLQALRDGSAGWSFVDNTTQLANIAAGSEPAPERLFGLVPVSSSLHSRDTTGRTNAYDPTVYDASNPNGAVPFVMPDLDELSQAAINTLKTDEDGFFLMIEGASVDSAAHANDLPRLIEEQLSFNRAIDAVIDWVETESSWDETLLIITTDHANALLLGPDSETIYMQDPIAQAPGELPEAIWWSTNHTNELVPLWTQGVGSDLFANLTDGIDPRRGAYIDNTDVYTVMSTVVPEPASATLLLGLLAVVRRR